MVASPQLSCAFATTRHSPKHVRVAEELGYARAWLYDTPQQSEDVWLTLALAAQNTSRIGLGPGVLVPSLRHPMVNARQTRTLQRIAPGRLAVAFGTGFTGRVAMGSRPLQWKYVSAYIRAYRGLLQGDIVEWEGARMRMLSTESDHFAPLELPPIILGAQGPLGARYAKELEVDGILAFGRPREAMKDHAWSAILTSGTVLDVDEDYASDRVKMAAGPGWAVKYHYAHAQGGADAVRLLPGGDAFLRVVEMSAEQDRHLIVHSGHLVRMNRADVAAWDAGGHVLIDQILTIGTASQVAQSVKNLIDLGATEIIYQPAGNDIPRELERFRDATKAVLS
jgi:5,10-methylenetetrahydromethanopterin reductase